MTIALPRPRPAVRSACVRPTPNPQELRRAFSRVPTSITVAAAHVDGRAVGMAIGSFTTISLDPGIVQFSVQATSSTWPLLQEAPRVGISVLVDGHRDKVRQLAGPSEGRFEGLRWFATDGSAVLIDDASAHFTGSISQVIPVGDHFVVFIDVEHCAAVESVARPLVFHESRIDSLSSRGQ